jgi:hypothetical protein
MAQPAEKISVEKYRAEDLEMDDVVQLRIANRNVWVLLLADNEKTHNDLIVRLTYRDMLGGRQTKDVPRYDLIPVQVKKGTT